MTSHVTGAASRTAIPLPAFTMPPGMSVRYDRAAAALADCITGYAIYANDSRETRHDWFLPAPAMIVILLDAGDVSVRTRGRSFAPVARVSLWGPSTHAYRVETHGGISVGVGLTAVGWRRLTGRPAKDFRDQVVPLADVIGPAGPAALMAMLASGADDLAFAPPLDRALPALLGPAREQDAVAHALERLTVTDGIISVEAVAQHLAIDTRDLRRLATGYFGMPVKSLLSRARFIRSLAGWMMAGEPASYRGIDSSYFDVSHFLYDARRYLGTTPRRFTRQDTTFLKASLHARAAVIGTSSHALHTRTPE